MIMMMANEKANSKLFRINLQMHGNKLEYEPSLDETVDKSFMQTIKNLIADICSVTSQIKKIAQPAIDTNTTATANSTSSQNFVSYQSKLYAILEWNEIGTNTQYIGPFPNTFFVVELDQDEDIKQLQNDIIYAVRLTTCYANKYLEQFLCYDYIWLDDKHLRLKTFLQECERNLTDENDDDDADDEYGEDNAGDFIAGGNANGENDVCDPNLQTEMFQNQVRLVQLFIFTVDSVKATIDKLHDTKDKIHQKCPTWVCACVWNKFGWNSILESWTENGVCVRVISRMMYATCQNTARAQQANAMAYEGNNVKILETPRAYAREQLF